MAPHGSEGVSGYRTQSADTSPEVEEFLFSHWRSLESWQKFELIFDQTAAAETVCLSGIRRRYPDATEREPGRRRLRLAGAPRGERRRPRAW